MLVIRALRLRHGCALGLLLSVAYANAQTVELTTTVQLKLTNALYAIAPAKLEALQVSAPLINYEGLTRALSQTPNCGSVNTSAVSGALRMAAVVNQVICNRLGVREGFGLTEQARAALELAESQRQPSLNLAVGMDAERGGNTNGTVALRMEWLLFDFGASSAGIQQSRLALAAVLDDQRAEVPFGLG
jgi:outer membrane protein TolC